MSPLPYLLLISCETRRGPISSGRGADRLAAHSGITRASQFPSEEAADSSGRPIEGCKKVGVAFLDRNASEWQDFGADATLVAGPTVGSDADGNLAHVAPEPCQRKPQPPLDVGLECPFDICSVKVRSDPHPFLLDWLSNGNLELFVG